MNDNPTTAYPAEYYPPAFIYSRPDDPRQATPFQLPLVTSVDNGIRSPTKVSTPFQQINESERNQQQTPARLAVNIATNQGLSDNGMIEPTRTDPKRNLVRNPAQKNLPRLFVDDSTIRQTLQTPRQLQVNLDNRSEQITTYNPTNNGQKNGYLINITKSYQPRKQEKAKYGYNGQPVYNEWKKEVLIDDKGAVTNEPPLYKEPPYRGPFGLSRTSAYVYYIGMALFTILAVVLLVVYGILRSTYYTNISTSSGTSIGVAVCAIAFYLGLQAILVAIWHQKRRREEAKRAILNPMKQNSSLTYGRSTRPNIQDSAMYGYSYPPYGYYPGTPTGSGFYPPVVWPYNGALEAPTDPRLMQPIDWRSGQQTNNGARSTSQLLPAKNNKTEKKSHKKKKIVKADPPKIKPHNAFWNSPIHDPLSPSLNKAPETKEFIQQNAMVDNNERKPTISPLGKVNKETETTPPNVHRHRHSDSHHHLRHSHRNHDYHHHSSYRRRRSYSPCSICSNNEFFTEASDDAHHYHRHRQSLPRTYTPRHTRSRTLSPRTLNAKIYRDSGVVTDRERKPTKDSSVTTDFQYAPNNPDTNLQHFALVHRTGIVEPYSAELSSRIVFTPPTDIIGIFHLDDNQSIHNDNDRISQRSVASTNNKKTKKKKKRTKSKANGNEDLNVEDVNENEYSSAESNTKKPYKYKTIRNRIPLTPYTIQFLFQENQGYFSRNPNRTLEPRGFHSVATILIDSNQNRISDSSSDVQMLNRPWSPEVWQQLLISLDGSIENIKVNDSKFVFQSKPISTMSLRLSQETFGWKIIHDNQITENITNSQAIDKTLTSRVFLQLNR